MAYRNLDTALQNEGITQKMLAVHLEISEKSVFNKLKGKSPITIEEYRKICLLLNKYNRDWLFTENADEQ